MLNVHEYFGLDFDKWPWLYQSNDHSGQNVCILYLNMGYKKMNIPCVKKKQIKRPIIINVSTLLIIANQILFTYYEALIGKKVDIANHFNN